MIKIGTLSNDVCAVTVVFQFQGDLKQTTKIENEQHPKHMAPLSPTG